MTKEYLLLYKYSKRYWSLAKNASSKFEFMESYGKMLLNLSDQSASLTLFEQMLYGLEPSPKLRQGPEKAVNITLSRFKNMGKSAMIDNPSNKQSSDHLMLK